MIARRFKAKTDYPELAQWAIKRGVSVPQLQRLPKYGVFVPNAAVCFLVKTDAKVGILDFLITNPEASEENRLKACDLGIALLLSRARELGLEVVMMSTQIPKVLAITLRYGFIGEREPFFVSKILITQGDKENAGSSNLNPNADPGSNNAAQKDSESQGAGIHQS